MEVRLTRTHYTDTEVLGKLVVYEEGDEIFSCVTLEQPWNNNKRNISCIPLGEYTVTKYNSIKYPDTFEILNVPNRSYILIHWGNYYFNTEGCILLGREIYDINGDGVPDVTNSKDTLDEFRDVVGDEDFDISIVCGCGC